MSEEATVAVVISIIAIFGFCVFVYLYKIKKVPEVKAMIVVDFLYAFLASLFFYLTILNDDIATTIIIFATLFAHGLIVYFSLKKLHYLVFKDKKKER